MRERRQRSYRPWINASLALTVVVIIVVALVVGARTAREIEPFRGSDAVVAQQIEDNGYRPWVNPLLSPSGEIESGLFALQAGLGGLALGFVLGALWQRYRSRGAAQSDLERSHGPDAR